MKPSPEWKAMKPTTKPMPKPKVDLDQPIFAPVLIEVPDDDSQTVQPDPSQTMLTGVKVEKPPESAASSMASGNAASDASAVQKPDAGQKKEVLQERGRSRSPRRSAMKRTDSQTTLVLGSSCYYDSDDSES